MSDADAESVCVCARRDVGPGLGRARDHAQHPCLRRALLLPPPHPARVASMPSSLLLLPATHPGPTSSA
eukprot:756712-Rhodomonas_salina.3